MQAAPRLRVLPGLSAKITNTLKSPYAREYTVGVNGSVGSGSYRMDFVRRDFKDFYNTVLNTSTGQATDVAGNNYDVGIIGNTNDLERNYTALQTQFQYRFFNNQLNMGGAWTWSHTLGNFDGEAGNSGPVTAGFQQYPEYKQMSWNVPRGDLATDQRHRVRVFGTYDLPFIPQNIGIFSFSAVQAYDTGVPYGAVGTVRSRNYVTNPGYITPPSSVTYYFTARDAFRTPAVKRTDLSLQFRRRSAASSRSSSSRRSRTSSTTRVSWVSTAALASWVSTRRCGRLFPRERATRSRGSTLSPRHRSSVPTTTRPTRLRTGITARASERRSTRAATRRRVSTLSPADCASSPAFYFSFSIIRSRGSSPAPFSSWVTLPA